MKSVIVTKGRETSAAVFGIRESNYYTGAIHSQNQTVLLTWLLYACVSQLPPVPSELQVE